jgi:hypothetical protein
MESASFDVMFAANVRAAFVLVAAFAPGMVFIEGEVIHTESSHKYRPEVFGALVERDGWRVKTARTARTSVAASFGVFLLDTEGLEGVVERHITNEHRV